MTAPAKARPSLEGRMAQAYRDGFAAAQGKQSVTANPHDPTASDAVTRVLAKMWVRGYGEGNPMPDEDDDPEDDEQPTLATAQFPGVDSLALTRHVRTSGGAERYKLPIGSPIPEGRKRGPNIGRIDGSGRPGGSRERNAAKPAPKTPSGSTPKASSNPSLARSSSGSISRKNLGANQVKGRRAAMMAKRDVFVHDDGSISPTAPREGGYVRFDAQGNAFRSANGGKPKRVPDARVQALVATHSSDKSHDAPAAKVSEPAAKPKTAEPKAPEPAAGKAHEHSSGRAAHAAEQPDVQRDDTIGGELASALQQAGRTGRTHYVGRDAAGNRVITDQYLDVHGTHLEVSPHGHVSNVVDGKVTGVTDAGVDKHVTPFLGERPKETPAAGSKVDSTPRGYNPKGREVTDRVDTNGMNPAAREQAHIALDAIAKVHSDGDLQNDVRARSDDDPLYRGSFVALAGTRDSYSAPTDSVDEIRLKDAGPSKALTFTHEVGHYLDKRGLGQDGMEFSSRGTDQDRLTGPEAEAMRGFLDAARQSQALQDIAAKADMVGMPGYRAYLESPHEMFARGYAQFIATRSGDPTMLRQLRIEQEKGRSSSRPPMQWEDDDFAAVDAAIEKVLQAKGWMKDRRDV